MFCFYCDFINMMLKNNCFLFSLWVLISGALYYMTVTVLISQPGAGWYSHSPPVTLVQYSTVSAAAIINWSGFNYPLLFPDQPSSGCKLAIIITITIGTTCVFCVFSVMCCVTRRRDLPSTSQVILNTGPRDTWHTWHAPRCWHRAADYGDT